jgi:hypothetical protein
MFLRVGSEITEELDLVPEVCQPMTTAKKMDPL